MFLMSIYINTTLEGDILEISIFKTDHFEKHSGFTLVLTSPLLP